jgi:hypothetical protein
MYYYSSEKRYNICEYETKSAVEIDRVATLEEDGAFRIYRVYEPCWRAKIFCASYGDSTVFLNVIFIRGSWQKHESSHN